MTVKPKRNLSNKYDKAKIIKRHTLSRGGCKTWKERRK